MAVRNTSERSPRRDIPNSGESVAVIFDEDKLGSKIHIVRNDFELADRRYINDIIFTVSSNKQNGNENGELVSEVKSTVSFSAPSIIASSNSIAKG